MSTVASLYDHFEKCCTEGTGDVIVFPIAYPNQYVSHRAVVARVMRRHADSQKTTDSNASGAIAGSDSSMSLH